MRTPKQIQASRTNGARSKGPVTPQGKRNSSRNSTRHGLLAETVVCLGESTARFLQLVESLVQEYQPKTPTEHILVETIASATWRRGRIVGMQTVGFNVEVTARNTTLDTPASKAYHALRDSADSVRVHELLMRYETMLDRQMSRALLRLQQLRSKNADRASNTSRETLSQQPAQNESPTAARTQQPAESKPAAAITRESATDSPQMQNETQNEMQNAAKAAPAPLPRRPPISTTQNNPSPEAAPLQFAPVRTFNRSTKQS